MEHDRFVCYRADASKEEELSRIFQTQKPEYAFHLAANSDIQASAENPGVEYRNTYSTTFQILCCMRQFGAKKLFFASTPAVYGDQQDVELDENTSRLAPISYYGAAKLGSEALVSAFSYMNDMQVLVFRFPKVIGPRLTHGVIHDFMQKLQKDPGHLRILGDGRQSKPYLHVTDLVDAIMQFKETAGLGVTLYNVGAEEETSVNKIADIVCRELGFENVQYEYTGGEGGWKGDETRFQYCLDKIHKAGWRARYASYEAARRTARENQSRI